MNSSMQNQTQYVWYCIYVIHMQFLISCHLFQFEVAIPFTVQCFPSQLYRMQSTLQDTEATHKLQREQDSYTKAARTTFLNEK